jgi:hypothetical protein
MDNIWPVPLSAPIFPSRARLSEPRTERSGVSGSVYRLLRSAGCAARKAGRGSDASPARTRLALAQAFPPGHISAG